jgi:hypothetical protein
LPLVKVTFLPTGVGDPEQVLDEKYSYWTVPWALLVSPDSLAVSNTELPTVIETADKVVNMLVEFFTVSGSHGLVALMLLMLPLSAFHIAFQL